MDANAPTEVVVEIGADVAELGAAQHDVTGVVCGEGSSLESLGDFGGAELAVVDFGWPSVESESLGGGPELMPVRIVA